ncbi:MAG: hypothetical protein M3N43_04140 [Actinomycetota bacterium]|nr:hypothetical protein [Actinomycetota bacterium]
MSFYAVVDDFRAGMPQTTLVGALRPRGIADHTTEGAEGEAGALGTIQFLIDRADRNASYGEVWYAKGDGFEARRIVPPENASHSMSPNPTVWQPDARVRRILGDRWWDPNSVSYSVSIAGSTAVTVPALIGNPGFMAGARKRNAELMAQFRASLTPDPLFNHAEGQTDRSDWGPLMRPAILSTEDDMIIRKPLVREQWTTRTGDFGWFKRAHDGTTGQFMTAEKVWSTAELTLSDGANARLIEFNGDPLIILRAHLIAIPGTRTVGITPVAADCSVQDATITALNRKISDARVPAAATVDALR